MSYDARQMAREIVDAHEENEWYRTAEAITAALERAYAAGVQAHADRFDAEMAWGIIANVSGGDWTKQSEEWQGAAARWRDHYFAAALRAGEGVADFVKEV